MPQRARLLYRTSDGTEQEHTLDPNAREHTIGRHPDCAVTVYHQTSVSRRHARLLSDGRSFTLEDLKSSNGTYVNNQRIQQTVLQDGDTFRCGDLEFFFTLEEASGDAALIESPPPIPEVEARPEWQDADAKGVRRVEATSDRSPRLSIRPAGRLPSGGAMPRRAAPQPRPTMMPQPRAIPRRLDSSGNARPSGAPQGRRGVSATPKPVPVGPISRATINSNAMGQENAALKEEIERLKGALAEAEETKRGLELELKEGVEHARLKGEAEVRRTRARLEEAQAGQAEAQAQLEAERREKADLQGRLEAQKDENAALSSQLDDGAVGAGDQRSRIEGLEREVARLEEQLRGSSDRAIQLKEQNQSQQRQLEEYRVERAELERQLLESQAESEALRQNQGVASERESELVDNLNALKREVNQKNREIKNLQDRADEYEYDLKALKEENQTLQLALGDDSNARKGLNTTIEHLRKVLAEKESMIEGVQAELGRAERRIEMLEARLRDASGENFSQLQEQLTQLRAIRDELNRENQELKGEVERLKAEGGGGGGGNAGNHRQLMDQINELRREARQLRKERDEARAGQGGPAGPAPSGDVEDLQLALEDERRDRRAAQKAKAKLEAQAKGLNQRIEALGRELEEARAAGAAAAPAPAPAAGGASDAGFDDLFQQAVEVYEEVNDLASDLRSNIELTQTGLMDLEGLIAVAVEAAQKGLDATMANRLRSAVDEADPDWNLPSSKEALDNAYTTSEAFKKALRNFRKTLTQHGYGS